MESIVFGVDGGALGIGDLGAFGTASGVDGARDGETCRGSSSGDELDDELTGEQRLAAPVLAGVALDSREPEDDGKRPCYCGCRYR